MSDGPSTDALQSLRSRLEVLKAKAADTGIPYCPEKPSPQQAKFLALDAFDAFYGGAAGGGKSSALLMDNLRFAKRPGFSGLILRKTLTDLALPGAIMDRAKAWLIPHGVQWNEVAKIFTFTTEGAPARLQFGYCETANDVFRYQGSEFHRISIDELTQWDEQPVQYLKSRTRRKSRDEIPLGFRGAGNPGGRGHKWVKARYVHPGAPDRPFVPAKAQDNPGLRVDEYLDTLSALDETTRAQLRDGLWIDDGVGLVYKLDRDRNLVTVHGLPDLTADGWQPVLAVDLGASEIEATTAFAMVFWHPEIATAYCVRSWKEAGMTPTTCGEMIREVIRAFPSCRVTMDEGALGVGYANEMRTRFAVPVVAAEKRDKQGARRLLNGALERGELLIAWDDCRGLVDELESLRWHPSGIKDDPSSSPNHESDALLYAWRMAQSWRSAYHVPVEPETQEQAWERRDREKWQSNQRSPWASW